MKKITNTSERSGRVDEYGFEPGEAVDVPDSDAAQVADRLGRQVGSMNVSVVDAGADREAPVKKEPALSTKSKAVPKGE